MEGQGALSSHLVECEAGGADLDGEVAGDVGRRPGRTQSRVQERSTGSEERSRNASELPLIGVAADEARPECPLPGDALLQLCHRRHAHFLFLSLSLSLSPLLFTVSLSNEVSTASKHCEGMHAKYVYVGVRTEDSAAYL